MARPKNPVPSYTRHASGQARARWTDAAGIRHERMLPGPYDSAESRAAHARLLLENETAPHRVNLANADGITVNELVECYRVHAERHYRHPDGELTNEVLLIKIVCRHVRELYGTTVAADFGPLALKTVRQKFIGLGWCRRSINQQIERVRRIFKWAVAEELVPPGVHQALCAVDGLKRGRTPARESKPVLPVDDAVVDATLPFLNRHVRAMVELQRHTGMRPGEVCRMRLAEIDRTGDTWFYRPARHKTQHHGKDRVVMIGPKGRSIIEAFIAGGLVVDPTAPLFSPRRAREERYAAMRAARKSKVQPSQQDRRVANPKLTPAESYVPNAYHTAIHAAAMKAQVGVWNPNQLRHLYATEVRKNHGLEAAQVLLGHSRADVTQIYTARDHELAAAVAAKIG